MRLLIDECVTSDYGFYFLDTTAKRPVWPTWLA